MGAEYCDLKLEASKDLLNEAFNSIVEQAQYDHGHAGYSGSFAEKDSFAIHDVVMDEANAYDYCQEHATKWGDAIFIPLNEERTEWYLGAVCSS